MGRSIFLVAILMIGACARIVEAADDDPLQAQPDVSDNLALTIYGDGRALIEDNRRIRLSGGEEVIELPGVSSAILPQSVTVKAGNMEIIEQNFDFDLLTPQKLMSKAVGEYIEIVKTNPATGDELRETAKVLSVNNGVVIQVGDRIEILRDDNIPTRVVFPKVPENLRASPTLSLRVDASAGSRDANMTYISSGLKWASDYVAVFNEENKQLSLQGWATIDNTTNTTFHDAELSVVAGYVGSGNQNNYNRHNRNNYNRNYNQGQRRGGIEAGSVERIGDNYLYPLPGKTTLASKQKKQISFVDAADVKAEKVYEYYNWNFTGSGTPFNVESRIAFSNSKAGGMGEALPAGTVRVYMEDKRGKAQFVGEDNIGHIAAGSDISMKIGDAFDITVKPTLVKSNNVNRRVTEYEMLYEVRNASKKDQNVHLFQKLPSRWCDYEVLEEDIKGVQKDDATRLYKVPVETEGQTVLTFKIRQTCPW